MNPKSRIVLAAVVGAALGAAAVQGLHAQAKPKAYIVTETEVIDASALAAYVPQAQAAARAAGGRPGIVPAGGESRWFDWRAAKASWRLRVGKLGKSAGVLQFAGTEGARRTAQ